MGREEARAWRRTICCRWSCLAIDFLLLMRRRPHALHMVPARRHLGVAAVPHAEHCGTTRSTCQRRFVTGWVVGSGRWWSAQRERAHLLRWRMHARKGEDGGVEGVRSARVLDLGRSDREFRVHSMGLVQSRPVRHAAELRKDHVVHVDVVVVGD
jgi:hypothetical protein